MVDDDPDIRSILTDALTPEYVVHTARDGAEGIADVEAGIPALVLLDLRMPRSDGLYFAAGLRSRHIYPPIVLVTGEKDASQVATRIGAVACLAKPVDLDELLHTVERFARAA